jgi:hypothetical protein
MCGYLRSRETIGTTTGGCQSGRNRLTPRPDPGSMRTPRLDRLARLTQGTAWRSKRYLSWIQLLPIPRHSCWELLTFCGICR